MFLDELIEIEVVEDYISTGDFLLLIDNLKVQLRHALLISDRHAFLVRICID